MRCRTITGTVTSVRVPEILRDKSVGPIPQPNGRTFVSRRSSSLDTILPTAKASMSGLFAFDWQTHTYHAKVLLMEFKTLYSERSLSRLCILNRYFNIILVSAFKVNKKRINTELGNDFKESNQGTIRIITNCKFA
jgi:hypothetical protein